MANSSGSTSWLRRRALWLLVALIIPALLPLGATTATATAQEDTLQVVCTPDTFRPDEWVVVECTSVITNNTQNVAPAGYLAVMTVDGPIPEYFWMSNSDGSGRYTPVGTGDISFNGGPLQPGQSTEAHLVGLLRMSEGTWQGEDSLFSGEQKTATIRLQFVARTGADAPPSNLVVTKDLVETVAPTPTPSTGQDSLAPTPTCPPLDWENTPTRLPQGYVEPTLTPAASVGDLGPNSGYATLSPEEIELGKEKSDLAQRYYEKKMAEEPLGCLADDMKAWAAKVGVPGAYGDISRDSLPGSTDETPVQQAVYETTITNSSSSTVTSLTITDRTDYVDLIEMEPAPASRNDDAHLVTWDLASFGKDSLAPGESLVVRQVYGPLESGGCSNVSSGVVVEAEVGGTVERYGTRPEDEALVGDCDYDYAGQGDPIAFGRGGEGPGDGVFDLAWAAMCLAMAGAALVGLAALVRRWARR